MMNRRTLVKACLLSAFRPLASFAGVCTGGKFPSGTDDRAPVPKWLNEAVFYQIYPQSFLDTNADGIGDLEGIIQKLDYIRSLGCNALWLNPIFESPFQDAGYDVSDFKKIAPRYGTEKDFKRLCVEAHRRGMRVCLDLVAGHTSIEHPWFKESALAQHNERSDWYIWTPAADAMSKTFPVEGVGNRGERYLANYLPFQAALNYGYAPPDPARPWQKSVTDVSCQAVQKMLRETMLYWLARGADGFRVDMASSLIRGEERASAVRAFWLETRKEMRKSFPEAVLIAEWGHPAEAIRAGFDIDFLLHVGEPAYKDLVGPTSHPRPGGRTPASFFDLDGGGDVKRFLGNYMQNFEQVAGVGFMSMPTSNHDFPRPSHGRTNDELKVMYAMLFTMPGVPFLYYGDEIGMKFLSDAPNKEGANLPGRRAGSRTPMQWDETPNAGFSAAPSAALYLPIDPAENRPNVASQVLDPASLLNTVRTLLHLRKKRRALHNDSAFVPLYAKERQVPFCYLRGDQGSGVIVAINPSSKPVEIDWAWGHAQTLLKQRVELSKGRLRMEGVSFGIFSVGKPAKFEF